MAITGALVKLYHPDDKPEGVDKDGVVLEAGGGYLGQVNGILADLQDEAKERIVTDQFRRCCAEIFHLVDKERGAQGRDLWGDNQKIIFVYEMYRTAKLYEDKTRKDGTSVFYSHLVGTVKNVICDVGLTGIISLLAMLKHDQVEDFVDDNRLKRVGREAALKRVKDMVALTAFAEDGDSRSHEVLGNADKYRKMLLTLLGDVCTGFVQEVMDVLTAGAIEIPKDQDLKAVDKELVKDIRLLVSKSVGMAELAARRDPSEPQVVDDMEEIVHDLSDISRTAKAGFKKYVEHASKPASAREQRRIEKEMYATLLDTSMYRDKIAGYDEVLTELVIDEVRELVNGLTKLRKRDRDATLEATVLHHLSQVRTYPIAALLKAGGDRPHNTATIEGHKPEKARHIMDETELAYVPEADVFKIRRSLRRLVYDCVKFFNSTLLKRYDKTLDARLRDRLRRKFKDSILEAFSVGEDNLFNAALDRVADVQFLPRGIDYYTRRAPRKEFADLRFRDLQIDALDPMFEILVTTNVDESKMFELKQLEDDIKSLKNKRAAVLRKMAKIKKSDKTGTLDDLNYPQLSRLADDIKVSVDEKLAKVNSLRLAPMSAAMAYIVDKFAKDGGFDVNADFTVRGKDDPNKIFGIILTLFNERFGGQLQFRINDAQAEARSKRGVIAETGNIPDELMVMIGATLDKTLARMKGVKGMEAVNVETYAPRITVKTMSGESREFPVGATGFDFAGSIHSDILIGAQRILEKDAVSSRVPAREVSLWDELHAGKVYIVESCKPSAKKVKAGLKWLLFTQSSAGNYLRRHFRQRLNIKKRVSMSRAYLGELAQIYNLDIGYIQDILVRKFARQFIDDDEYGDVPAGGNDAAISAAKSEFLEKIYRPGDNPQAVKVRRRIWERILNSVGDGDINPVLVLSQKCEASMGGWRHAVHDNIRFLRKKTGRYKDINSAMAARSVTVLKKAEKDSNKWEVEVEVPEDIGSLDAFAAEFSKEAGISIYHMKEHVRGVLSGKGKKAKPGILKLIFDLDNSRVSQYEFFRKLLKLSFKYKVRVVDRMQVKFDQHRVSDLLRGNDVAGSGVVATPVNSNSASSQVEMFNDRPGRK